MFLIQLMSVYAYEFESEKLSLIEWIAIFEVHGHKIFSFCNISEIIIFFLLSDNNWIFTVIWLVENGVFRSLNNRKIPKTACLAEKNCFKWIKFLLSLLQGIWVRVFHWRLSACGFVQTVKIQPCHSRVLNVDRCRRCFYIYIYIYHIMKSHL